MLRVRQPESKLLQLGDGDFIVVKKYLTAGEYRRILARQVKRWEAGQQRELDPVQVGRSQIVEYLLDWSALNADGKPLVIRDKSPDEIGVALDSLPPAAYTVIQQAIDAHIEAMELELALEKNARDGGIVSSAISPSVA